MIGAAVVEEAGTVADVIGDEWEDSDTLMRLEGRLVPGRCVTCWTAGWCCRAAGVCSALWSGWQVWNRRNSQTVLTLIAAGGLSRRRSGISSSVGLCSGANNRPEMVGVSGSALTLRSVPRSSCRPMLLCGAGLEGWMIARSWLGLNACSAVTGRGWAPRRSAWTCRWSGSSEGTGSRRPRRS